MAQALFGSQTLPAPYQLLLRLPQERTTDTVCCCCVEVTCVVACSYTITVDDKCFPSLCCVNIHLCCEASYILLPPAPVRGSSLC